MAETSAESRNLLRWQMSESHRTRTLGPLPPLCRTAIAAPVEVTVGMQVKCSFEIRPASTLHCLTRLYRLW